LIEADEENKRMEQLRIDEEKRRDERKKESSRVSCFG
jgi:microfibrillar-associated protein 1